MAAPHQSGGEWAGYASAAIILLASIGGGVKWLLGWRAALRKTRAEGLQQWEDKLSAREDAIDDAIDLRLLALERENTARAEECQALRIAFELVAGALRSVDPHNTALARAEQILASSFPLSVAIPADMVATLNVIEARDFTGRVHP